MKEDTAQELVGLLAGLLGDKGDKQGCCHCPNPPVTNQYEQSLARFNETASQNSALMQQTAIQTHQAWSAHLLKLQADICKVDQ
jgi:hypothetical protein